MVMPSKDFERPAPSGLPLSYRISDAVLRFYRGKIPLWRAFWGYFVLGGLVLKGGAWLPTMIAGRTPQAVSLSLAILVGYLTFAVIGVWRCANAYTVQNGAPILAKILIVVFSVSMIALAFR